MKTTSQTLLRLAVILIVVGLVLFGLLAFQVRQNEKVILTRFGRPVRVLLDPGLYARWPWPVESVNRLDGRLQFFENRLGETLTSDKRNVIVQVFVAWRIQDPLKFLKALGSLENAAAKLEGLVTSARNSVLGGYEFAQLVSIEPEKVKLPEIEEKILAAIRLSAENSFGIAVEQVGIKRLALPESNTRFVFERMRAERAQLAARYRAEGNQQADAIRVETDAEKIRILAQARRFAEETRGAAEAEAAKIYSAAHRQDPSLYRFLRELEAFRQICSTNTVLVIDASSAPFRLLKTDPRDRAVKP